MQGDADDGHLVEAGGETAESAMEARTNGATPDPRRRRRRRSSVMSVRLSPDRARMVRGMAGQHGTSLSELLNRAVDALIAARPSHVEAGTSIRLLAGPGAGRAGAETRGLVVAVVNGERVYRSSTS